MTFFNCKVSYDKLQENGTSVKKVTEAFLIEADSFTEAEERTLVERQPYISGEAGMVSVAKTKINEIFYNDEGDKYYLVKWAIISLDEKPTAMGKPPVEKKVQCQTLVQGNTLEEALKEFNQNMKGTLGDFEILSIAETPYLDVYPLNK